MPENSDQLDSIRTDSMGILHALHVMGPILEQIHYNSTIILSSKNLELIKRTI